MPGSQNGGPRPRLAKAETIHGLVRAGDLAGVQRKLRETPDLLNDKNPVVHAAPFSFACLGGKCDLWSVSSFLMLAVRVRGKTMVARILGKLLHMAGILPTDKVIEVQRTDLVGEFVGHTGPKTRRKIQDAEGGILFVDEAYRLIPMQKSDDKDYGLEALEEIMSVMDSGKIVVIFAGYCEPMKRVITSNDGFCRRVTKFFYFDDFSTTELAEILHMKMKSPSESSLLYGFKLHPSCSIEVIGDLIGRETTEERRKQMNGGLVDTLLINARENLDLRLDFNCNDADTMITVMLEDLEAGLRQISRQRQLQ
nr:unnamed protein product [Digitaria exilis]